MLEVVGVLECICTGFLRSEILIGATGAQCKLLSSLECQCISKQLRLMSITYDVQLIRTDLIISSSSLLSVYMILIRVWDD